MYDKDRQPGVQDWGVSLVNDPFLSVVFLFFLLAWLVFPLPLNAQIAFQEESASAGIDKGKNTTMGESWGDFNADGRPDIWIGNHGKIPSLFINKGDGTFTDIVQTVWKPSPGWDDHGVAWGDFDNDGDADLFEIVGEPWEGQTGDNNFYVNTGEILDNQASQYGVQYPPEGGRTPLWWDWNRDGLLDLVLSNCKKPYESLLLQRQINGPFINISTQVGFNVPFGAYFGQLSDLDLDDQLDLLVYGLSRIRVYSQNNGLLLDRTSTLGLSGIFSNIQDAVVADLDGDLRPDLFLALGGKERSDAEQTQSTEIQGQLLLSHGEQGLSFQTAGTVSFSLSPAHSAADSNYSKLTKNQIYIGETGQHPNSLKFSLAPKQQWEGMLPHQPGTDRGIFIGFDSVQKRWRLLSSSPTTDKLTIIIRSNQIISDFGTIGFSPFTPLIKNKFFVNKPGKFVDATVAAGLNIPAECNSVAAGDFDNDMDLDLYLVCSRTVANRPNILYENLGHGIFVKIPDAGGAAGSDLGAGDSVAIADYNEDGFLDLFVTNGGRFNPPPLGPGSNQLFRNLGNSNHWLELDLEGVISNRDGIGAKVLVTTGGVTQLREQNGGMHLYSQDHKRLHVGLGQNTRIDTLEVRWPSGIMQTVKNLPVDQVLRLIEPVKPVVIGAPPYQAGVDEGVYLWKQSRQGAYQLRVSGVAATDYEVKLVSSLPLPEVTPIGLETGVDSWQRGASGFALTARVGGGDAEDGVSFRVEPGARVLLAVTREGAPNPRQLHVGPQGLPLSPAGWIVPVAELGGRPTLGKGELGLAIGAGTVPGWVEARWGGDRWTHGMQVDLLSSEAVTAVTPQDLESNDQVMQTASGVRVLGWVATGQDGVDVQVAPATQLGIGYQQDHLLPRFVKSGTGGLGMPNAYWLPGTP